MSFSKIKSFEVDLKLDENGEPVDEQESICVICMNSMSSGKELKCGHRFHTYCLE